VAGYHHPPEVKARLHFLRAKNEPFAEPEADEAEVKAKVVTPPKKKAPKGVEGVKVK
jgi:hypothetical protein